jgi:hypothetical protein
VTRFAMHRIPADSFPFTVRAYGDGQPEPYWTVTVDRPTDMALRGLRVPSCKEHGVDHCERIVIEWGNGTRTVVMDPQEFG